MSLPFLPGNSFNKNLGKDKFHKSHFFDYNADVAVFDIKSGIGGEPLPGQTTAKNRSIYPEGIGSGQPTWVAFDRQVLRFFAYFQEGIEEKAEEQFRIRNCVILFYLEDDSIQVNEKINENSGIPQGTLIRRHRIPLPPPNDDQFYTIDNFNVGEKIEFYSKTFHITGCDRFTESFLQKIGFKVHPSQVTPSDPYSQHREKMLSAMQPQRPYERLDTLKQFLDYDRKVLRFYCLWDDTESMFGDQHELVLHYYLADDTIEILEKVPPNAGKDAIPVFLKRARLPKNPPGVHQPGVKTTRTVLNVFGPNGDGSRYILDALKTGEVLIDYYYENDLIVGAYLNVWGRKILLCDCDDFTKQFYCAKYNINDFQSIQFPQETPRKVKPEIPPHTGFGSEEDSLSSYYNLIPKAPRKDYIKFMLKDRAGLNSNILRFVANMKTSKGIDSERIFIIYYYLSDDTTSVFEPPIRNSGIIGGMFLQRGKIAKPRASSTDITVYYQPEDFYIGADLIFNKFHFIVFDADEYALRYMEEECDQFPHANIRLILAKLKGPATVHVDQIRATFKDADSENNGLIPDDQFKTLVKSLAKSLLNEHEVITLSRHYKVKKDPPLGSLIAIVQDDLKRLNYNSFSELLKEFQSSDESKCGFIEREELLHLCNILKLPLSDQLIQAMMENCEKDLKKRISYKQFVQLLNWEEFPAPSTKIPTGNVIQINYGALIGDLTTRYQ
jgi:Ca2+-binding EF-hand superfamily protein